MSSVNTISKLSETLAAVKRQNRLKSETIEAQAKEIKRLKEGAMQLSTMVLGHLVNETDFSDDLSMQSFAIHVKEDLCK